MTGPVTAVLYEDSRGATRNFGLHGLVLACVADRIQVDRWALRTCVPCIPKNGDSNLLEACREHVGTLYPYPLVLAVFDDDKIRDLLKLPADACKSACKSVVVGRIKDTCFAPSALSVTLLGRNTEDVLRAVAGCRPVEAATLTAAVDRKDVNARDAILNGAASADPAVRICIQKAVPSLERIVTLLADYLARVS
jgi:hypothetical protein